MLYCMYKIRNSISFEKLLKVNISRSCSFVLYLTSFHSNILMSFCKIFCCPSVQYSADLLSNNLPCCPIFCLSCQYSAVLLTNILLFFRPCFCCPSVHVLMSFCKIFCFPSFQYLLTLCLIFSSLLSNILPVLSILLSF